MSMPYGYRRIAPMTELEKQLEWLQALMDTLKEADVKLSIMKQNIYNQISLCREEINEQKGKGRTTSK
jgi:hypothetical protein